MPDYLKALTIIGIGLLWLLLTLPGRGQTDRPAYEPSPFQWHDRLDSEGNRWLVLSFADGRRTAIIRASITSVAYVPTKTAKALGLPRPYIQVTTGGKATRIDLTADDEARAFF